MDSSVSISSDSLVIKLREKLCGYHDQNHDSSNFLDNQGESTENKDDSFEQDNHVENTSVRTAVPDDFEEYHEGDKPGEHKEGGPTKTDDPSIDDPPVESSDSSSSPSSSDDGTSSDGSSVPSSDSSMKDYSSLSDTSDGAMTNDISRDSEVSSNAEKSESTLSSSKYETGSDSSTTEADQMEEDSVNATNTPPQSWKVNHPTEYTFDHVVVDKEAFLSAAPMNTASPAVSDSIMLRKILRRRLTGNADGLTNYMAGKQAASFMAYELDTREGGNNSLAYNLMTSGACGGYSELGFRKNQSPKVFSKQVILQQIMLTINDTFQNVGEEYIRKKKQFEKGKHSKGSGIHLNVGWLDIKKAGG